MCIGLFRRNQPGSATAAEPDAQTLFAEIEEQSACNRAHRDPEVERRILALRHQAGAELAGSGIDAAFADPDDAALRDPVDGGLPEHRPDELTPGLVRAGMLRDGAVLVRGLLDRDDATTFAAEIERAVRAREALRNGEQPEAGYYEEFEAGPGHERAWVGHGGVWGADSPKLMFDMLDAFERSGLRQVIHGYLGEVPAISVQKCTMRKVDPDSGSGWHQDGAFLGDVRALNVWLALSHCGDVAPGLDVIPSRLNEIVPTGTEGAAFDWSVSPAVVEGVAAANGGVTRPIFEPGDVLLFDEMNLHSTAVSPSMTEPRYAIETWFFGLSGFPAEYVPIAY